MEMGFDEKEVMDALRVNNNQQNAAVSNTAGRRRRVPWALRQAGRQVGGGELPGRGWGGSFAHLRGQSRAVAKQLGDRGAWTWGTPSPARPLPRSRAQRS